ncbi:MAG: Gfo/Idh/MocA family oxidoreductase [Chloroflexi bacterium]|nr:Gfo/Idh/MocA family oxidoreductase [Chloroflexota bacterium]
MAQAALICTLDDLHLAPTIAALEAGYDVLLEKPMATTVEDCVRLVQTAERSGRVLMLCHVLRYTSFFSALHDVIAAGRLGEIITVEHRENVSFWHMAHSYVRGNWRHSRLAPMILAKCCHDFDILFWNLGPVKRLSSFGSLLHYRAENAPPGAPERCTDGCPYEAECPWYAPRLYLDLIPLMQEGRWSRSAMERLFAGLYLDHPLLTNLARRLIPPLDAGLDYREWPISVISEDTSLEARRRALESGPYGRCVYRCDNDVVDHQMVNMELESGASAVLVMHGHSHQESRTMRYDGSRATLFGQFYLTDSEIQIHDHLTGKVELIRPEPGRAGHGGGDEGVMRAFVRALRQGRVEPLTSARASLESHLLAFAAEQARLEGAIVDMAAYRQQVEGVA